MENVLEEISSALSNLSSPQELQDLIDVALSQNIPVSDVVEKGLRSGLQEVGVRYENGEYFLAELLFAASTIDQVMQMLRPKLSAKTLRGKGTILGNAVTKEFAQQVGADAAALDAFQGVEFCRDTIEGIET